MGRAEGLKQAMQASPSGSASSNDTDRLTCVPLCGNGMGRGMGTLGMVTGVVHKLRDGPMQNIPVLNPGVLSPV